MKMIANAVTKLMGCMQEAQNLQDSLVNNEQSPSSPQTRETRKVIIDVNEPVSEFCADMRQIKQSEWDKVIEMMPIDDKLKAGNKIIQCINQ